MTKPQFLLLLDEFFELKPGTLKGNEVLKDLPNWDSLKLVELIALVDEQLNVSVPPARLVKSNTLNDLVSLLGESIKA